MICDDDDDDDATADDSEGPKENYFLPNDRRNCVKGFFLFSVDDGRGGVVGLKLGFHQ